MSKFTAVDPELTMTVPPIMLTAPSCNPIPLRIMLPGWLPLAKEVFGEVFCSRMVIWLPEEVTSTVPLRSPGFTPDPPSS